VVSVRRLTQIGFLGLTAVGVWLVRGNAERWCPLGGVESLPTLLAEGNLLCSLAVTNLFVLGAVLLATLALKRAFCGYACPIGAISEWTGRLGRLLRLPRLRIPRRLDAALSLLPYLLLAVVLYFTWRTGELVLRGYDPCYALIGRHGADITAWAYVVSAAVLLASLLVSLPFCRWLCPFAAVLSPISRLSPARIARAEETCVECGECGEACPMGLHPEEATRLSAGACTACLDCVAACPEPETLAFGTGRGQRRGIPRVAVAAVLVGLVAAGAAAALALDLPSFTWKRGDRPAATKTVELSIVGLDCRGRANLLVFFLTRRDDLEIPGYLELAAWPGPGRGRAEVTYDPARTSADEVRFAITSPDLETWRMSPFAIEGFDPLAPREAPR
jgi:polyferredoxin